MLYKLKSTLFLLIFTLSSPTVLAVSPPSQRQEPAPFSRHYKYYNWQRIKNSVISPVTTPAITGVYGGLTTVAILLATRENTVDPLQESLSTRKPLGESAKWGDWMGQLIPNLLYAGGMYGYHQWSGSPLAKERSLYMVEVSAYSGIFTMISKTIAHEKRPNGSDYRSFPSGHTTTAFAFAAGVGIEHGWKWGVPAYVLAGFVGISRINDNKHYLHDVVAGATVGITYAFGLNYYHQALHKKLQAEQKKGVAFLGILPLIPSRQGSQGITANFSF